MTSSDSTTRASFDTIDTECASFVVDSKASPSQATNLTAPIAIAVKSRNEVNFSSLVPYSDQLEQEQEHEHEQDQEYEEESGETSSKSKRGRRLGLGGTGNSSVYVDPSSGLFFNQQEYIRAIQRSLLDMGLVHAATTLQRESGLPLDCPVFIELCACIKQGKWDIALQLVTSVDFDSTPISTPSHPPPSAGAGAGADTDAAIRRTGRDAASSSSVRSLESALGEWLGAHDQQRATSTGTGTGTVPPTQSLASVSVPVLGGIREQGVTDIHWAILLIHELRFIKMEKTTVSKKSKI